MIRVCSAALPWLCCFNCSLRHGSCAVCSCRQPNWNQGFFGKVMSLTASSFASALLLDADSMPLANPEGEDEPQGAWHGQYCLCSIRPVMRCQK